MGNINIFNHFELLWTPTRICNHLFNVSYLGSDHLSGVNTPQKRLLRELLDDYGTPSLRPVHNLSRAVEVKLRLLIAQVISFVSISYV